MREQTLCLIGAPKKTQKEDPQTCYTFRSRQELGADGQKWMARHRQEGKQPKESPLTLFF